MMLTDLAIEGLERNGEATLAGLHPRLNVVVGTADQRSALRRLWDLCLAQTTAPAATGPRGWIRIRHHDQALRLGWGHAGLSTDRLTSDGHWAACQTSAEWGPALSAFDRDCIAGLLTVHCDPAAPENDAAAVSNAGMTWLRQFGRTDGGIWRTEAEYRAWSESAAQRRRLLDARKAELAGLESTRHAILSRIAELALAEESQRRAQLGLNAARDEVAALQTTIAGSESRRASLSREIAELEARIAAWIPETVMENTVPVAHLRLAGLLERIDEVDVQLEYWHRLLAGIQEQRTRLGQAARNAQPLSVASAEHPYHRAAEIIGQLEGLVDEADRGTRIRPDAAAGEIRFVEHPPAHEFAAQVNANCQRQRASLRELCTELENQYRHVRHRADVAELRQLRHWHDEAAASIQRLVDRRQAMLEEAAGLDPALLALVRQQEAVFFRLLRTEGYLEARSRIGAAPVSTSTAVTAPVSRIAGIEPLRQRLALLVSERQGLLAEEQGARDRLAALQLRLQGSTVDTSLLAELASLRNRQQELDRQIESLRLQLGSLQREVDEDARRPAWTPDPALALASSILSQLGGSPARTDLFGTGATIHGPIRLTVSTADGHLSDLSELPAGMRRDVRVALALAAQQLARPRGGGLPLLVELSGNELDGAWVNRLTRLIEQQGLAGDQIVLLCDRAPVLSSGQGTGPNDLLKVFDLLPREPAVSTARIVAWETLPAVSRTQPGVGRAVEPAAAGYPPVLCPAPLAQPASGTRFSSSLASFQELAPPAGHLPVVETGISEETLLQNVNLCPPDLLRMLAAIRVTSIGDLLELDPADPPVALVHASQSAAELDHIQAAAWLMVCVPGLTTDEARLLTDSGILEPEQLDGLSPDELLPRLQRQLAVGADRYPRELAARLGRDRLTRWQRSLSASRRSWHHPGGQSRRSRRGNRGRTRLNPAGQGSWFSRQRSGPWRVGESYFDERGRARPSIWREPEELDEEEPRGPEPQPKRAWRRDSGEPAGESHDPGARGSNGFHTADRSTRQYPSRLAPLTPDPHYRGDRAIAPARSRDSDDDRAPRAEREPRARETDSRESNLNGTRTASTESAVPDGLRFYLNLDDPVEAAPSIGPRTAEKFEAIGIRSIRDFLRTTAESMADRLDYKRINAEVIRQWQDQARLVCRIPNLRGHDAQLLVAVGINEPEQLESLSPRQLLDRVGPFADTREGLKIIRSGKKPDLAEVTQWLEWVRHTRNLSAA